MNKQEIFDKVSAHLLKQGHRSMSPYPLKCDIDNERCSYRGSHGDMCAIGCLIPDELYSTNMEGKSICGLALPGNPFNLPEFFYSENHILNDLQVAHDDPMWKSIVGLTYALNRVATDHDLTPYSPTP